MDINKQILQIEGFDWNSANTNKIRTKHKVEPHECEEAFFNELAVSIDTLHSHTEARYHALSRAHSGRLLFIVFTLRNNKIRVISARDMNKKERTAYYEKIKKDTSF